MFNLPCDIDCVADDNDLPMWVVMDRDCNVLCACIRREGEDTDDQAKKRAEWICEILNAKGRT